MLFIFSRYEEEAGRCPKKQLFVSSTTVIYNKPLFLLPRIFHFLWDSSAPATLSQSSISLNISRPNNRFSNFSSKLPPKCFSNFSSESPEVSEFPVPFLKNLGFQCENNFNILRLHGTSNHYFCFFRIINRSHHHFCFRFNSLRFATHLLYQVIVRRYKNFIFIFSEKPWR